MDLFRLFYLFYEGRIITPKWISCVLASFVKSYNSIKRTRIRDCVWPRMSYCHHEQRSGMDTAFYIYTWTKLCTSKTISIHFNKIRIFYRSIARSYGWPDVVSKRNEQRSSLPVTKIYKVCSGGPCIISAGADVGCHWGSPNRLACHMYKEWFIFKLISTK